MIREGDIVRLTGDPPTHAVVRANSRTPLADVKRGHLRVMPICGHHPARDVRTADVMAHWRRAKPRPR